jgi:hypothetical protein
MDRLMPAFGQVSGVAKQAFDILFHGDFKGGPLSEDSGIVDKLFDIRDGFIKFGDSVRTFVTSDTFQRWVGIAKDAAGQFWTALQGLGGFMTGTLLPVLGDVGGWLGKYSGWLIPIAGAIGAVVIAWQTYTLYVTVAGAVTKAYAAIQAALNAVMAMNPIGLVVLALVALVGAFVVAYKNSETFRDIVQSAWQAIQTAAGVAWGMLKGYFSLISAEIHIVGDVFGWLVDRATDAWHWVVDRFTSMKDGVVAVFGGIKDTVTGIWNGMLDVFKTPVRLVFDFVNKSMIGPINGLLGKFPGGLHIDPLSVGFAGGGYTGDGGKYEPKGVVHGGEYVFTKEETAKAGRENLAMLAKSLRGYDVGGFVGDVGHAIGGAATGVFDYAKDIAEKGARKVAELIINPLRNTAKGLVPGGNVVGDVVRGFVDKLADSVLGKSDEQDKAQQAVMASVTATGAVGSGVQRWAPLVSQALAMLGQPASLIPTVLRRMGQESGGNAMAINNWDVNAARGTPSKGLMQVIDPTFRANAYPGYATNIYDPLSNILASMRYAIGRYGSLAAAYNRSGGYELGTDFVPETGPYVLHKGEAVVPAAANSGWTGGKNMTVIAQFGTETIEARTVRVVDSALGSMADGIHYAGA